MVCPAAPSVSSCGCAVFRRFYPCLTAEKESSCLLSADFQRSVFFAHLHRATDSHFRCSGFDSFLIPNVLSSPSTCPFALSACFSSLHLIMRSTRFVVHHQGTQLVRRLLRYRHNLARSGNDDASNTWPAHQHFIYPTIRRLALTITTSSLLHTHTFSMISPTS